MTDRTSSKAFNNATGKTAAEDATSRARRMAKEKKFFEDKAAEYRGNVHSHQTHESLDLSRRHDAQKERQDEKLRQAYGDQKDQTRDQIKKLKAKGKKSGLSDAERERGKALQRNLADIQKREKEQIDALAKKQAKEREQLKEKHKGQTQRADRTVELERQQRQAEGWKPKPVIFDAAASAKAGEMSFQKPVNVGQGGDGAKASKDAPRPSLKPRGASSTARQDAAPKAVGNKAGMGL